MPCSTYEANNLCHVWLAATCDFDEFMKILLMKFFFVCYAKTTTVLRRERLLIK